MNTDTKAIRHQSFPDTINRWHILWVTVLVILLDQATKLRVSYFMQLGESLSVLGDFFRLTYITNTGAAFSFSLGNDEINRLFFIVVSIVAILVFLFLLIKERRLITRIAYALILGGAFGNLIDRILYGAVIDFFDFKFFSFIMERWPVFNIADSAIVIAIFLLLFDLIVAPKDEKPGEGTENNFQTIEESL